MDLKQRLMTLDEGTHIDVFTDSSGTFKLVLYGISDGILIGRNNRVTEDFTVYLDTRKIIGYEIRTPKD